MGKMAAMKFSCKLFDYAYIEEFNPHANLIIWKWLSMVKKNEIGTNSRAEDKKRETEEPIYLLRY